MIIDLLSICCSSSLIISNCSHEAKLITSNNPRFFIFSFFWQWISNLPYILFWLQYCSQSLLPSWKGFFLERARHGCAPKRGEQGGEERIAPGCMFCTLCVEIPCREHFWGKLVHLLCMSWLVFQVLPSEELWEPRMLLYLRCCHSHLSSWK